MGWPLLLSVSLSTIMALIGLLLLLSIRVVINSANRARRRTQPWPAVKGNVMLRCCAKSFWLIIRIVSIVWISPKVLLEQTQSMKLWEWKWCTNMVENWMNLPAAGFVRKVEQRDNKKSHQIDTYCRCQIYHKQFRSSSYAPFTACFICTTKSSHGVETGSFKRTCLRAFKAWRTYFCCISAGTKM